jgi:hypothetical protein
MPLLVETADPSAMLQEIKDKIDATDIKTWSYQGDQFEYLAAQYANEAVLDATVTATGVKFTFAWKKEATKKTYAVMAIYFGRFAEEILSHFDKTSFIRLRIPALR